MIIGTVLKSNAMQNPLSLKRVTAFAVADAIRRLRYGVASLRLGRFLGLGLKIKSLVIAPRDLRTADPTQAADILDGRYGFAGQIVNAITFSVYEAGPPSREWAIELHSFGFLRHLAVADSEIAVQSARQHVNDWIARARDHHPQAFLVPVVARRVMSWLSHSPIILADADHVFYRRFMRALSQDAAFLAGVGRFSNDPAAQLLSTIALAFVGVSADNQPRLLRFTHRRLNLTLKRHFLSDGGHISRDPGFLIETMALLLPLREAYTARSVEPGPILMKTIDRGMPLLRFFRHSDGSFPRFNGSSSTPGDLLATLLTYDEARGEAPANARYSGYQRFEAGDFVFIADTGNVPPMAFSRRAHAGALSFEFSSGVSTVVMNCGVPRETHRELRQSARSTAAHSTLSIAGHPSVEFYDGFLDTSSNELPYILRGPENIQVLREDEDDRVIVSAFHDAYLDDYGFRHKRTFNLLRSGQCLIGRDELIVPEGQEIPRPQALCQIRFHLHPNVSVTNLTDNSVDLLLARERGWRFICKDLSYYLDDSALFSTVYGVQKSEQIVIEFELGTLDSIEWQFSELLAVE